MNDKVPKEGANEKVFCLDRGLLKKEGVATIDAPMARDVTPVREGNNITARACLHGMMVFKRF